MSIISEKANPGGIGIISKKHRLCQPSPLVLSYLNLSIMSAIERKIIKKWVYTNKENLSYQSN